MSTKFWLAFIPRDKACGFSRSPFDKEIGDTFKITGTVKEHSEYKGVKQTVLTRCKIV